MQSSTPLPAATTEAKSLDVVFKEKEAKLIETHKALKENYKITYAQAVTVENKNIETLRRKIKIYSTLLDHRSTIIKRIKCEREATAELKIKNITTGSYIDTGLTDEEKKNCGLTSNMGASTTILEYKLRRMKLEIDAKEEKIKTNKEVIQANSKLAETEIILLKKYHEYHLTAPKRKRSGPLYISALAKLSPLIDNLFNGVTPTSEKLDEVLEDIETHFNHLSIHFTSDQHVFVKEIRNIFAVSNDLLSPLQRYNLLVVIACKLFLDPLVRGLSIDFSPANMHKASSADEKIVPPYVNSAIVMSLISHDKTLNETFQNANPIKLNKINFHLQKCVESYLPTERNIRNLKASYQALYKSTSSNNTGNKTSKECNPIKIFQNELAQLLGENLTNTYLKEIIIQAWFQMLLPKEITCVTNNFLVPYNENDMKKTFINILNINALIASLIAGRNSDNKNDMSKSIANRKIKRSLSHRDLQDGNEGSNENSLNNENGKSSDSPLEAALKNMGITKPLLISDITGFISFKKQLPEKFHEKLLQHSTTFRQSRSKSREQDIQQKLKRSQSETRGSNHSGFQFFSHPPVNIPPQAHSPTPIPLSERERETSFVF